MWNTENAMSSRQRSVYTACCDVENASKSQLIFDSSLMPDILHALAIRGLDQVRLKVFGQELKQKP